MANKKITQLTALTNSTVDTTDVLPIVDISGNETDKITYQNLMRPKDSVFGIVGSSDTTKIVAFEVDGLTTATTRTITIPDANFTLVGLDTTQTLTNKTLTSPQINMASNATGDMYYRDGTGTTVRLPIGTTLQVLNVDASGIPAWVANPSATAATTSAAGVVELATTAETETGTDATRAVTPDGLHDMTTLAGAAWFLDEDTMSSDSATKTASQQSIKAYVDNSNSSLFSSVPNTKPTYTGGYYTYEAPITSYHDGATYRVAGWTTNSVPTTDDGAGGFYGIQISAAGSPYLYTSLPKFATAGSSGLLFSNIGTNTISLKMRVILKDSGDTYSAIGLSDDTNVLSLVQVETDTTYSTARFVYDSTANKLFSVTSKAGTGYTSNEITGITISNANIYQIDINSANVKFYVNGVLKFTHTTNIPNAAAGIRLGFAGKYLTTGACEMDVSPVTITMPLTAS